MSAEPSIRFLHTSHLALDRFCVEPGDVPAALRAEFVTAPFLAAERLFNLAIRERVEFVLLGGSVFHNGVPSTWGARFVAFQCERLRAEGIPVIWCEADGRALRHWPSFIARPDNLTILAADGDATRSFESRCGTPITVTCGSSLRDMETKLAGPKPAGLRLAVLPRCELPSTLDDARADYWAFEGGPRRAALCSDAINAHTAGTPQPRRRGEAHLGGCLLVAARPGGRAIAEFQETNHLRWLDELVNVERTSNWEGFRRTIHARLDAIASKSTARVNLVRWTVRGHGPVIDRLAALSALQSLTRELRDSFDSRPSLTWSVSLALEPDVVLESQWRCDAGDVGEFVRSLDQLTPGDVTANDLNQRPASLTGPHYQPHIRLAARRHGVETLVRAP